MRQEGNAVHGAGPGPAGKRLQVVADHARRVVAFQRTAHVGDQSSLGVEQITGRGGQAARFGIEDDRLGRADGAVDRGQTID